MKRLMGVAPAVLAVACLGAATGARAAELPKATEALLEELKTDASVLAGLDQELAVPRAWIEGARKEGEVKIVSTFDDNHFRVLSGPFAERYPFIRINYARGSFETRTTRVLVALKAGHYTADVISGFGGAYRLFRNADHLADMRDLPGYRNLDPATRGEDGTWVAHRRQYWCIAHNTTLARKEDMPRTWEALVEDTRWHGQKIGMGNRPQLWILMLWGQKGEAWTRSYLTRLFGAVRPQLRKEGMNALVSLAIAGEFHMAIPASEYRVAQSADKGAPIGYHCPEPVPMAVAEMGIIKGSPRINAARLFVNWFLSKEGQIAQFVSSQSVPIHKDLQKKEFLPFADEILGKTIAPRTISVMETHGREVTRAWNGHWAKGTGLGERRTVDVKLAAVKERGRTVAFQVGGEAHEVQISGSRTEISIDGKKARRSALKQGMACAVTYRGPGDEAQAIACK